MRSRKPAVSGVADRPRRGAPSPCPAETAERAQFHAPEASPAQAHPEPRFFKRSRPGSCPCSLPKASEPGGRISELRSRTSGLARIPDLRPAPGRLRRRGHAQEAAASPEELDPCRDGRVQAGKISGGFKDRPQARFGQPPTDPAAIVTLSLDHVHAAPSSPKPANPRALPGKAVLSSVLLPPGSRSSGAAAASAERLPQGSGGAVRLSARRTAVRDSDGARKAGRRPGEFRLEQPPGSPDGCLPGARP